MTRKERGQQEVVRTPLTTLTSTALSQLPGTPLCHSVTISAVRLSAECRASSLAVKWKPIIMPSSTFESTFLVRSLLRAQASLRTFKHVQTSQTTQRRVHWSPAPHAARACLISSSKSSTRALRCLALHLPSVPTTRFPCQHDPCTTHSAALSSACSSTLSRCLNTHHDCDLRCKYDGISLCTSSLTIAEAVVGP